MQYVTIGRNRVSTLWEEICGPLSCLRLCVTYGYYGTDAWWRSPKTSIQREGFRIDRVNATVPRGLNYSFTIKQCLSHHVPFHFLLFSPCGSSHRCTYRCNSFTGCLFLEFLFLGNKHVEVSQFKEGTA